MTHRTKRIDEWTADDNMVLAEVVLKHIREKSTLRSAYEDASVRITRTASACSNKWNTYLKFAYAEAIEFAKLQRNSKRQ